MRRSVGSTVLIFAVAFFGMFAAAPVHAQYQNVALGKTVTAFGTFGVPRPGSPWLNPPSSATSTLTDGTVLPNGTNWQQGTVWWDAGRVVSQTDPDFFDTRLELDLGSVFSLTGFGLSYDNNDRYRYFTRVSDADAWTPWFTISCNNCPPGMIYGGFPGFFAADPRDARYLAVVAYDGDGYYSLSEIEAYVSTVPEPTSVALIGTGLLGVAIMSRRRRAR